jgi:hypothetical protein
MRSLTIIIEHVSRVRTFDIGVKSRIPERKKEDVTKMMEKAT